jgi:hypothetical protein
MFHSIFTYQAQNIVFFCLQKHSTLISTQKKQNYVTSGTPIITKQWYDKRHRYLCQWIKIYYTFSVSLTFSLWLLYRFSENKIKFYALMLILVVISRWVLTNMFQSHKKCMRQGYMGDIFSVYVCVLVCWSRNSNEIILSTPNNFTKTTSESFEVMLSASQPQIEQSVLFPKDAKPWLSWGFGHKFDIIVGQKDIKIYISTWLA